jgi:hypothetical protein
MVGRSGARNGNLGFAQISFGDGEGVLRTMTIPVLLYYRVESTQPGVDGKPVVVDMPYQRGWFGINALPDRIDVPESQTPTDGRPACALGVKVTCWVSSVLDYLEYRPGVTAGFRLDPFPMQTGALFDSGTTDMAINTAMPAPRIIGQIESVSRPIEGLNQTTRRPDPQGPLRKRIDSFAILETA